MMSFMRKVLDQNTPIWDDCANTRFVKALQDGTLPFEEFKQYMIQDSIYLKHYARVFAKAMYHSQTLREIQLYYSVLSFVTDTESALRLDCLKQFDITDDDIEHMAALPENERYTDFMLEVSERGDTCEILMAALPCMLSYNYIFEKVSALPGTQGSRYFDFIHSYTDEHYSENCKYWCAFADEKCANSSEEKKEMLMGIFKQSSLLELDFWNMDYAKQ